MQPTSMAVINYLLSQGCTQSEIARLLKVNRSFISHIAHGKRNLTLNHLETLAESQRMTVPELYVKATPLESVPKDLRKGYSLFLKAMNSRHEIKTKSRKVAM